MGGKLTRKEKMALRRKEAEARAKAGKEAVAPPSKSKDNPKLTAKENMVRLREGTATAVETANTSQGRGLKPPPLSSKERTAQRRQDVRSARSSALAGCAAPPRSWSLTPRLSASCARFCTF